MRTLLTQLGRILSGTAFLLLIVVSVPLAFDVGGRGCGLAFSLYITLFYFFLCTLRLSIPQQSYARLIVTLGGVLQYLVVPALLIFCLDQFSAEENVSETPTDKFRWVISGWTASAPPVGGEDPTWVER